MLTTSPPAPREVLTVPRLTREEIADALDVAVSTVEAYASTGAAYAHSCPTRRRAYGNAGARARADYRESGGCQWLVVQGVRCEAAQGGVFL